MMGNKRQKRGHATVTNDEGVNYRDIAETMTELGFTMNHSSARNYVVRVMKKFAKEFIDDLDENFDESRIESIAKSPQFQSAMADILHVIESTRKKNY